MASLTMTTAEPGLRVFVSCRRRSHRGDSRVDSQNVGVSLPERHSQFSADPVVCNSAVRRFLSATQFKCGGSPHLPPFRLPKREPIRDQRFTPRTVSPTTDLQSTVVQLGGVCLCGAAQTIEFELEIGGAARI